MSGQRASATHTRKQWVLGQRRLSARRLDRVNHEPLLRADLSVNPDCPFVRDASNKLVRRGYWMDMNDRTLVMVMTQGIGANLTNDEKRAHLSDLKRESLIDQVCTHEILPPER